MFPVLDFAGYGRGDSCQRCQRRSYPDARFHFGELWGSDRSEDNLPRVRARHRKKGILHGHMRAHHQWKHARWTTAKSFSILCLHANGSWLPAGLQQVLVWTMRPLQRSASIGPLRKAAATSCPSAETFLSILRVNNFDFYKYKSNESFWHENDKQSD